MRGSACRPALLVSSGEHLGAGISEIIAGDCFAAEDAARNDKLASRMSQAALQYPWSPPYEAATMSFPGQATPSSTRNRREERRRRCSSHRQAGKSYLPCDAATPLESPATTAAMGLSRVYRLAGRVPVTGRGDRDPVASRAPSYLDSGARRRCGFDATAEMWYILRTLGA
jgi:hypothetical protein